MDMQILTTFFMWCTIINGGIMIYWAIFILFAPDFIYRMQNRWIPISRESFNLLMYSFLGLFKIVFIVFNLVPYIVLLIIA